MLLVVEHHIIAGYSYATCMRRARCGVAAGLAIALSAFVLPSGSAQQTPPLPDLVSDPPRPSFFNEILGADGNSRLVLTFDGYVHNVGEGALDVVGNPQEPDGMKQRVWTGDDWQEVGSPTVRYETDDGHDHFHLIEVIEYVLWNQARGQQTATGSKIGFCLVDSEQMEPGTDQVYSEDKDNFCEEGNPGATSLRMGISPGWRDIYDATTTLQWVDVSNVAPGRYWIGAITDPNDEIRESNEDNNDLVFSDRSIAVPGFEPREQASVDVDAAKVPFTLGSTAHGNVGTPVYVIESGPTAGVLDVPVGVDLHSGLVHYIPTAGFVGEDQITFSVRDSASPYPSTPPVQTVTFEVDGEAAVDNVATPNVAPSLEVSTTLFEIEVGQQFEAEVDVDGAGGPARLFATGLPAGLRVDDATGQISGRVSQAGVYDAELVAVGATADQVTVQPVTWFVTAAANPLALAAVPARSSPRGETTQLRVGPSTLGLTYIATGLPEGLAIDETSPSIVGTPSELGDFSVEVRQLKQGAVVSETSFEWTIRPAITISFAL